MAFDINAFKTTGLPQGGARPSLFDVTVVFKSETDTFTNIPPGSYSVTVANPPSVPSNAGQTFPSANPIAPFGSHSTGT